MYKDCYVISQVRCASVTLVFIIEFNFGWLHQHPADADLGGSKYLNENLED